MLEMVVVGLGGFIGAVLRYGVTRWVQRLAAGGFPYGTFLVNVAGCLVIGVVFALVETRPQISANVRLFLTVGLLGSFTTFSTFGYETFELLRNGFWGLATANVVGSAALGLCAVVAGRFIGRLV